MLPSSWSDVVKAGVWLGELISKPALKKRKAYPLEIRMTAIGSSISLWRGVSLDTYYGYIDLEFRIIPHHVPVYVQALELRYKGDWFEGERTATARRDNYLEIGDHELVGTQITIKAMTPSYSTWFQLAIPDGSVMLNIAAVLVVESEGLPCEASLGTLQLKKIL